MCFARNKIEIPERQCTSLEAIGIFGPRAKRLSLERLYSAHGERVA